MSSTMVPRRVAVFAVALLGSDCSVPAAAEVGLSQEYTINASQIAVPDALRDTTTQTLRSIPCQSDRDCPSVGAGALSIACVASACDPAPLAFELASEPVDLNAQPAVRRYGDLITKVEVRSVEYAAAGQGLKIPVGPTVLYWGPESAAAIDSDGVVKLGEVPVIELPEGDTVAGNATLDAEGVQRLSEYLVGTSRRLRLFARPSVDLAPGQALPAGAVTVALQIRLHVEGQLVR